MKEAETAAAVEQWMVGLIGSGFVSWSLEWIPDVKDGESFELGR
jgi:hypothetical protein